MKTAKRFFILWFILFSLSYGCITFFQQQEALKNKQNELAAYQAELSRWEEENRHLIIALENARTDEHVRRFARERLGWIGPDEILYEQEE